MTFKIYKELRGKDIHDEKFPEIEHKIKSDLPVQLKSAVQIEDILSR